MFSIIWFESIFPVAIVKVGCTYVKVASKIQDFVAKSRKENNVVPFEGKTIYNSWVGYILKIPKLYWTL